MTPNLFTISIEESAPVTLRSLGIRGAVVHRASLDLGSLVLQIPVDDISDGTAFAYGQEIVLYRAAVKWFVGRVRSVAASFANQESSWTVTICDAWWEMEHTVYRQPRAIVPLSGTGLVGYLTPQVTLNQDAYGQPVTQSDQIATVLAYGATAAPGKIAIGAIPTLAQAWGVEETNTITVAEAVRRASKLAPSAYARAEYSTGIWTAVFAARASLTLVTLDLNAADVVLSVSGLRKRDDIVPPGILFDFFTSRVISGVEKPLLTRQSAGTPGAPGTIYAQFQLGPCAAVPSGAADAYYAALSTAQWEGSLTLMEEDITGQVQPGFRLRLTNGFAAWATMDAVVQRTSEDLFSGVTEIEVGPPDVLGMDDFVGQLNVFRNRPAPTGFCAVQHNGDDGLDDGGGPEDPGGAVPPSGGGGGGNTNAGGAGGPAGLPGGGIIGSTELTLCDGNTINVLTKP